MRVLLGFVKSVDAHAITHGLVIYLTMRLVVEFVSEWQTLSNQGGDSSMDL